MVRRKPGERNPEGYTRRRIVEWLLDYPDGITEPEIRDWLRESEDIREKKNIANQLQSLEKKSLLLKESEPGKENIWKLNPEAYKEIAEMYLETDDDSILKRMNSKYTQRVIEIYVFDEVSKKFSIDLSKEGNIEDLIKKILTKSPSVLKYVLTGRPKEEIEEKKSLFGNFLFGRSRGNGIDTLAFFSILLYADIAKYSDLAQTTEDIRRGIDSILLNLFHEKARKINEEFFESLKRD